MRARSRARHPHSWSRERLLELRDWPRRCACLDPAELELGPASRRLERDLTPSAGMIWGEQSMPRSLS